MSTKSVIIIGGGIAGLSTGIWARLNGYDSQIFEMHTIPGGLCTSWKKNHYTIDGCIHWLTGTKPGSIFYDDWKTIGVMDNFKYIQQDIFMSIENPEGKKAVFYSELEKTEKNLLELAPEDADTIKDFIASSKKLAGFKGVENPQTLFGKIIMMFKMLPYMRIFGKYMKLSIGEFAEKFRNPFLRDAFGQLWEKEMGIIFIMFTMAWADSKSLGYPIGGSLKWSIAVEKRFKELGGHIQYSSRVDKILVENGKAIGIKLTDGTEHFADYIISAADGYSTIFKMLDGNFVNDEVKNIYRSYKPFSPIIYIGLGVKRTFEEYPEMMAGSIFAIPTTKIAGREEKWLNYHIYNYDETLSPKGKTTIIVMINTDYEYWKELHGDPEKYSAEKEEIADKVIEMLETKFPGLREDIEMIDVATPMTFERYTGNWKGSYEGWLPTPSNFTKEMKKTLPGLDNFYLAGQWVSPGGGLPSGVMTAKSVIRSICKKDKKKFIKN